MPKTKTNGARQPVIAVVGHVDHGKSTLLDYIRKTNVAEKEAGGITQRIGAYEAIHTTADGKERRLSFIDTPGHEAFAVCRENSLCAADVGILVVAADEGTKPQTVEAFKQLTASKTPFVVAFTKTDKPNADVERAKQSLAEKEIFVEGYGGSVPSASVSSKNGEGVSALLDLVLLLAEMNETPCDTTRAGEGAVVEAERGSTQGISATLIVKNGVVRKGQALLAGEALSVIRTLTDFAENPLAEAGCGRIARIGGWSTLPKAGDPFRAYENKKAAEQALEAVREEQARGEKKPKKQEVNAMRVVVPLVIKADTAGSLEAIKYEMAKLNNEKIEMKIIGAGLGTIGEGDLRLAGSAREAVLVGFNVSADAAAIAHAKASGIEIHLFDVIYRLSEFLADMAKTRTPKEKREEMTGQARIVKIFSEEKNTQVVGGKVMEGILSLGDEFRIVRRNERIGTGRVKELQKFKEKIREAAVDTEFGALMASTFPLAVGDTIEVVKIVEI